MAYFYPEVSGLIEMEILSLLIQSLIMRLAYAQFASLVCLRSSQ